MKKLSLALAGFALAAQSFAFSAVEEKNRLVDMLSPLGDLIDRMAAHNVWHYKKNGKCDLFGISNADVVQPVADSTGGELSGNLVRYVFTDTDDCIMMVQFNEVSSDTDPATALGHAYESRLNNIMLKFTPIMENTNAGVAVAYDTSVHGEEQDLYTIADWKCEILEVTVTEATPSYNVTDNTTGPVATAVIGGNEFQTVTTTGYSSAKKPNPFTYMKTIGGTTTLINFSHELPGDLLKKCRNFSNAGS